MNLSFIKKSTRYRLTWLSKTVVFAMFALFFYHSYSFLAPTSPPHEGLMVVEGWMDDFSLNEAIKMYRNGNYSKIICTGPAIDTGNYLIQFHSYPEMTAARLFEKGFKTNEVLTVISPPVRRDRTYQAALDLKKALHREQIVETHLHLVTVGPHGRRSRLLFKKALKKEYQLGVTSLPATSYDSDHWYQCSSGVRDVVGEWIAYLYARFIFHPKAA